MSIRPGKTRKRLIKPARRISSEEIHSFLFQDDGLPRYFVLRSDDAELVRGWHPIHGIMVLSMEDDVMYCACIEHLKSHGLVFSSEADATEWRARRAKKLASEN